MQRVSTCPKQTRQVTVYAGAFKEYRLAAYETASMGEAEDMAVVTHSTTHLHSCGDAVGMANHYVSSR